MLIPQSIPGKQWAPYPGPQTRFLSCSADEALFGGQAGPGKTDCLLMFPLRFVHQRGFEGLMLRRTRKECKKTLWKRAMQWFPAIGGQPNLTDLYFTFAHGHSIIRFDGMESENDKYKFKSDEYQYVGFDEVSEFTRTQYVYMFSRVRSARGIPCFVRGGTNPGSEWLLERFAPWLYPPEHDDYDGIRAGPGVPLWCRNRGDSDEEERRLDKPPPPEAGEPPWMSRVFFPATRTDNPSLTRNDPGYEGRLQMLDRIERARLMHGDWMAAYAPGTMFLRQWWYHDNGERRADRIVDRIPCEVVARVRYWDRAATEEETGTDPDFTAGALVALGADGVLYVEHMAHFREEPPGVERRIREQADADAQQFGDVQQVLERDPGSAGKSEIIHYKRHILAAHDMRSWSPTGSKVTRAKPLSSDAEHGLLKFVRGPWVRKAIKELTEFPGGPSTKKDQVDALSGAKKRLAPLQLKLLKRLRKGQQTPVQQKRASRGDGQERLGRRSRTVGGF